MQVNVDSFPAGQTSRGTLFYRSSSPISIVKSVRFFVINRSEQNTRELLSIADRRVAELTEEIMMLAKQVEK